MRAAYSRTALVIAWTFESMTISRPRTGEGSGSTHSDSREWSRQQQIAADGRSNEARHELELLPGIYTMAHRVSCDVELPPYVSSMGALAHVLSALLTLPPTGDPIRVEPPPTAEIVDADGGEQQAAGPEAEVFVEVDERGRGDGYLAVDGELLAHVVYDAQVLAVWAS